MTEANGANGAQNPQATEQEGRVGIAIAGQYIKDLSFEVPGAPQIFSQMQKAPEIPISVDVQVAQLGGNHYEVTIHFDIKATVGDKPGFVMELVYGAVVQANAPQEHLHPLLLIEAPRLMFPFCRNLIADITRDGGFPPLMLQPIDFVQLYRQRAEAAQRARAEEGEEQA
ncbi:protein-export chaperone SecB [Caenispirillum bisanense]|uniref:Protein-export protein SecB n=1 Tax=Caenispirillum bisanense TaxID=414052 RepID=A0A286GBB8_9PROT|nr:protein-export chaperone SecB [Caenispirillum bisanense]SOD92304.1 protein translocase subunit secB [Caenispirillum bisanense]